MVVDLRGRNGCWIWKQIEAHSPYKCITSLYSVLNTMPVVGMERFPTGTADSEGGIHRTSGIGQESIRMKEIDTEFLVNPVHKQHQSIESSREGNEKHAKVLEKVGRQVEHVYMNVGRQLV
jgi:hypothetical protein